MAGMVQATVVCGGNSSGCVLKGRRISLNTTLASLQSRRSLQGLSLPRISAVKAPEECNEEEEEESAAEKQVGKLNLKWEAEEKTKVAGTYPPVTQNERRWTGYVEKDTAGQTNIYAVEPAVYVAESAISTGSAGDSGEGTKQPLAIAVALGLVAVASACAILLLLRKNTLATSEDSSTYSGPPLSYYSTKFKPTVAVEAAAASEASPLDN